MRIVLSTLTCLVVPMAMWAAELKLPPRPEGYAPNQHLQQRQYLKGTFWSETTCEYSKAIEKHGWMSHPVVGHIALQGHGAGHKPVFRKISIKPVNNKEPSK